MSKELNKYKVKVVGCTWLERNEKSFTVMSGTFLDAVKLAEQVAAREGADVVSVEEL